ncbi:MAG: hypothetical protein JWN63_3111 [Candidatus Acidoferrum typicum]|nr:hypothetical protein [Candidatus Acidoferrum typicum]
MQHYPSPRTAVAAQRLTLRKRIHSWSKGRSPRQRMRHALLCASRRVRIHAKKQQSTTGWREEQPREGVVRGWMVRKVNSKQKNQEEANVKF